MDIENSPKTQTTLRQGKRKLQAAITYNTLSKTTNPSMA